MKCPAAIKVHMNTMKHKNILKKKTATAPPLHPPKHNTFNIKKTTTNRNAHIESMAVRNCKARWWLKILAMRKAQAENWLVRSVRWAGAGVAARSGPHRRISGASSRTLLGLAAAAWPWPSSRVLLHSDVGNFTLMNMNKAGGGWTQEHLLLQNMWNWWQRACVYL